MTALPALAADSSDIFDENEFEQAICFEAPFYHTNFVYISASDEEFLIPYAGGGIGVSSQSVNMGYVWIGLIVVLAGILCAACFIVRRPAAKKRKSP